LRSSEGRGNFHFNFLDSFLLFNDYARDCTLFGLTAKAVSLKYSVGNEKHFASRKSFRGALYSVGPSIRTFTEHMKYQFEMVRLLITWITWISNWLFVRSGLQVFEWKTALLNITTWNSSSLASMTMGSLLLLSGVVGVDDWRELFLFLHE